MNLFRPFVLRVGILTISLFVVLYFIHSFQGQKQYIDLSVISVIVFGIQSIVLYYLLRLSVKSTNKQFFLSVTMMNMLVKMILSIGLLLFYKEKYHPSDGKFVIPFLAIYLMFTIFETSFMLDMSDKKP